MIPKSEAVVGQDQANSVSFRAALALAARDLGRERVEGRPP
jgi:hypothetical protein